MKLFRAHEATAFLSFFLISLLASVSHAEILCVVTPCSDYVPTYAPLPTVPAEKKLPVANFSFGRDSSTVPVTVLVNADASGTLATKWVVSDGQTSSLQSTTFKFEKVGTYTITLTVTDSGGNSDSTQVTFTTKPKPAAIFSAKPSSGAGPLVVSLDASATITTDTTAKYSWESSDGQVATGKNASMTFSKPGTYTVTLTVTDSAGITTKSQQSITVISGDYEILFKWAEATYPSLFKPSNQVTQSLGDYSFRSYSTTNSILGIKGGHLIYKGGVVGCDVTECDLGDYSQWLSKAKAAGF